MTEIIKELVGMLERLEHDVREIVDLGSPAPIWRNDSCPVVSNQQDIAEHYKDSLKLEQEFAYLKYRVKLAQKGHAREPIEILLDEARCLMIDRCNPLRGKYFRNIELNHRRKQ
jgi:hypothetical protein